MIKDGFKKNNTTWVQNEEVLFTYGGETSNGDAGRSIDNVHEM